MRMPAKNLPLNYDYWWQRPLTSDFSWKTANRKTENVTWARSCGRVCSLQFTFEQQEGGPAGKWLTARFFATKKCTASRLKARSSLLYSSAMCLLDFWTRVIPVFWAIKVMHFDLTKNNMAALNNERLAKIWNLGNVKLQTRNWKLQVAVSHEKPNAKGSNLIFKHAFFFHCKAVDPLKQLLENLEICISSLHVVSSFFC